MICFVSFVGFVFAVVTQGASEDVGDSTDFPWSRRRRSTTTLSPEPTWPPEPVVKRKPLVMSVSGGGIPSLTSGMGVARALKHLSGRDALSELTHLGGNSGGSWFNNLFLHSESFFRRVTDAGLPMDQLVHDWIKVHLETMKALNEEGGALQKEFGRVDLQEKESGTECMVFNPIVRKVFKLVQNMAILPERLLPLEAAPVLKEGFGDKSAATATFEDFNHTLPGCTQISVTALPPDAWTNHHKHAGHNDANELHAVMKNGTTIDMVDDRLSLPLAFISDGPNKHDWFYNEDIEQLLISPACPYQGLKKGKCKHSPYNPPQMSPLPLPKNPTIAEITVASGSATGFVSSPAIWKHMYTEFNDKVMPLLPTLGKDVCHYIPWEMRWLVGPLCDLVLKIGAKKVIEGVEQCWPFGAQALGSPMMKEGVSVAQAEEAGVNFRYLDGAYVENTAVPMTVAKAQRDCEQGLYDCSEPIKVILVNHGNITQDHQGPGIMNWTNMPSLKTLFAHPDRQIGTLAPGIMTTVGAPVQTIFEEAFPEKAEWKEYLNFPSRRKTHTFCRHNCTWVDDPVSSLYWEGMLTTVENNWYGVKAGTKVHFLAFSLELHSLVWPALLSVDAMKYSDPGMLFFAFGAKFEGSDMVNGHAPFAKAHHEAVGPVLEAFLNTPSETVFV